MNKKPIISCVMPVRDRDDLIGESIESIINQTENNWELIIVDDHSKNHNSLKKIVKSFKDDRIRLYKLTDENGIGIPAARNFGNMMAKGKYIAVMDSDDISYNYRFKLTLDRFIKEKCDVVYGEIDYWYPETGECKTREYKYRSRPFNYKELLKLDFIPHSTSAYRRCIAIKNPYNSFFRKSEDYDLFVRLAQQGLKYSFIDKSLTKYRIHKRSVQKNHKFLFEYEKIVQTTFK